MQGPGEEGIGMENTHLIFILIIFDFIFMDSVPHACRR